MISDKLVGLEFREGIYIIDTRSFTVTKCYNLPRRLYILDSDPLTRPELFQFLSILEEKIASFSTDITEGFWPLKYLYIIWGSENKYYILNRYLKKIWWKKILTV